MFTIGVWQVERLALGEAGKELTTGPASPEVYGRTTWQQDGAALLQLKTITLEPIPRPFAPFPSPPARLCRAYGIGSETCGLKLLNGEF